MKYHTCPTCGANLDPGERCDCGRAEDEAKVNQDLPGLTRIGTNLDCQGERNRILELIASIPDGDPVFLVLIAAFTAIDNEENVYSCPYCGKVNTISPPQVCRCKNAAQDAATSGTANTIAGANSHPDFTTGTGAMQGGNP